MIANILMLAIGLTVGGIAGWLVLRAQIREAQSRARSEGEVERAALAERLQSKEQQIQTLSHSIESCNAQIEKLCSELKVEAERRATAEEKNSRIPALQFNVDEQSKQVESLQAEITHLKTAQSELKTTLEQERKASEEKLALLNEAKQTLSDAFKALSSDALKSNNQSFLELAKATLEKFHAGAELDLTARQKAIDELVKPLATSLQKVDGKIAEIEKERTSAYATLTEQVKSLASTQVQLHCETANLVKALRAPQVRGRWGEVQLKRVVEMAGMLDHCDFVTQESVTTEDGRLRPDLIVKLPGGKNVVTDAKCPLQAYLDALSAVDEEARIAHLKRHAKQVGDHISKLAAKGYWDQFRPAPEFVVLFLPGETFFSAALEQDPSLIEAGNDQRVILATPTTLIALLRAVAYGWGQELIAKNAQDISDLGRQLYDRVRVVSEYWSKVGSSLNSAVESYNQAITSVERRLLSTARRLKELGAGTEKEIEILDRIETVAKIIPMAEMPAPAIAGGDAVMSGA